MQFWASLPFASVRVEGFVPFYSALYYAALFPAVWLLADTRRKGRFAALWPRIRPIALGFTAVAVWGDCCHASVPTLNYTSVLAAIGAKYSIPIDH